MLINFHFHVPKSFDSSESQIKLGYFHDNFEANLLWEWHDFQITIVMTIKGSCDFVSLSKIHSPPKSTGNTQEVVAPSRHD